jgi:hypothetical protein
MRRASRNIIRETANNRRAATRALVIREAEAEVKKITSAQAAIEKNNKQKSILERLQLPNTEFWNTLEKESPKLLDNYFLTQLRVLALLVHHRPISTWIPRGKGKITIFNSLCDHLLAKFPTPQFIWSAFWEYDISSIRIFDNEHIHKLPLIKAIVGIASGDSFSKLCKAGHFPVPLTNRQCHNFLTSSANSTFMSALRRVQIHTWGGDIRLLRGLMDRDVGKRLGSIANEEFLDSVIAWMSKNPMFDFKQFHPMMDFIWSKKFEDPKFSMKGRSVIAVLRAMEEWHQDLTKRKIISGEQYKSSGLKPAHYEFNHRTSSGNYESFYYDINEILNSKDLQAEGKAQHHCVLSYSQSIVNGVCSIWSMKLNGTRSLTIEVRNRSIVQARGNCNRQASSEEFKIMQRWASENNLSIQLSRW